MEKEEVVVEEANVVEENVAEEKPVEETPEVVEQNNTRPATSEDSQSGLMAFILALVGLTVCAIPFAGGIACIILGGIARKKASAGVITRQPFRTFQKIGKIVGIVDLPLGIISVLVWSIVVIIAIIGAIAAAIAGADEEVRIAISTICNF